jgi:alpha-galactosidase
MTVSDDRRQAIVGFYQVLNRPAPGPDRIRLRGLDAGLLYRISTWPAGDDSIARMNAVTRGGDDLMSAGLILDVGRHEAAALGDFWARLFVLEATD